MSDQPESLAAILAEMRKSAKDSYAEKTAKRLEDHEATGTRDALDIKDAIQCLRDDDKYLLDVADRIEAAAERERDAFSDLCKDKDATIDRLLVERDEAIKERAPGNAAAIREALNRAIDAIEELIALYDEEHTAAVKIGATWKRDDTSEVDAIVAKARSALAAPPEPPSNSSAMRAALVEVEGAIFEDEPGRFWLADAEVILHRVQAALSAPVRNCDRFATAEEAVAAFADHLRAWENEHGVLSEYPDHPVQVPAGAFAWLFAPAQEGGDHA